MGVQSSCVYIYIYLLICLVRITHFSKVHVVFLCLSILMFLAPQRTEGVELEVTGDVRVTEASDGVPA